MNKTLESLKAYGADVDGALDRLIDDEQLYVTCLDAFLQDDTFDILEKAMKTKSYDEAFNAAHTLKGVAGNLGLTPFYKSVCRLVELLRSHNYDEVSDVYEDVKIDYETLRSVLDE